MHPPSLEQAFVQQLIKQDTAGGQNLSPFSKRQRTAGEKNKNKTREKKIHK